MKYALLPQDTDDARNAESFEAAAQRRRARRVGAILCLVIVLIVAAVFAWKLSLQR